MRARTVLVLVIVIIAAVIFLTSFTATTTLEKFSAKRCRRIGERCKKYQCYINTTDAFL
jgi:hypothetical protein